MSETGSTAAYTFGDFYIPWYMMGAIERYITRGINPGDFLTAIICNNLRDAVGRADNINIRNLPAYVSYFYNEAPGPCWGSEENMLSWMAKVREEASE